MKHGVFLCDECLACRDPQLYCKHRPACPIAFIEKRRKRLQRQEQAAATPGDAGLAFPPAGPGEGKRGTLPGSE
jgi:hypothetical protein